MLKDLADKKSAQSLEVISVIADHISEQLDSILKDLGTLNVEPKHKEALQDIKEKHEEQRQEDTEEIEDLSPRAQAKEKLDRHEKTVDELLRDLENLRRQ